MGITKIHYSLYNLPESLLKINKSLISIYTTGALLQQDNIWVLHQIHLAKICCLQNSYSEKPTCLINLTSCITEQC